MSQESAPNRKQGLKFAAVLVFALLNGLAYLFVVPPWQHYDEPTHYEYVRLIVDRNRLPAVGDVDYPLRREIAASMIETGFFNTLSRPNWLADAGEIWIGVSELVH